MLLIKEKRDLILRRQPLRILTGLLKRSRYEYPKNTTK